MNAILDEMTPGVETVFVEGKQNFAPGEPFFDMFDEKTMNIWLRLLPSHNVS